MRHRVEAGAERDGERRRKSVASESMLHWHAHSQQECHLPARRASCSSTADPIDALPSQSMSRVVRTSSADRATLRTLINVAVPHTNLLRPNAIHRHLPQNRRLLPAPLYLGRKLTITSACAAASTTSANIARTGSSDGHGVRRGERVNHHERAVGRQKQRDGAPQYLGPRRPQ